MPSAGGGMGVGQLVPGSPFTSSPSPYSPTYSPHQVGRLHGSVPNLCRYLESRDAAGPRGLPPPDYAHLQRSFWALAQKGECKPEGREAVRSRWEGGRALMACPSPSHSAHLPQQCPGRPHR